MAKEQLLRPPFGEPVNLADYDPGYHADMNKKSARAAVKEMKDRLRDLQEMLYAQREKSLLIVLQAMDAGGKDGTIKNIFRGINPQGVKVASFKKPTEEELAHDFLWRVHQHTPGKGYIGVFNRSHYEDVLVVRVNNLVPPEAWEKRYDHINNFERLLADSGTRILKFFLHISKDEQKERLQERLDRPDKHWKFDIGDLPVRQQWDDYMQAFEAVLTRCHTEYAPWHIIPANRKWYRNYVVMKTILDTMEGMYLGYPEQQDDLSKVVIPD